MVVASRHNGSGLRVWLVIGANLIMRLQPSHHPTMTLLGTRPSPGSYKGTESFWLFITSASSASKPTVGECILQVMNFECQLMGTLQ